MTPVDSMGRSFLPPASSSSPPTAADLGRRSFRFMAAFTAGLVIPSFLLCATFAAAWVYSEQRRLIGDVTAQTARTLNQVDQFLSAQSVMLRGLGTSPALDPLNVARFDDQVRSLYGEQKIDIVVRDATGRTLHRTGTAEDRALPAIPASDDGRAILSDFIPRRRGTGGFAVLTLPVLRNGAVHLTLQAEIDLSAFTAVLEQSALGPERLASIADRHGHIVATNDANRLNPGELVPGFPERTGPQGIWIGINQTGQEVRMAYQRLPESGWMVSVGMTEAAFRAPLVRSIQWLIFLTFVTVVGTVALLTPLVRQRVGYQRAAFLAEERLRVSEERLGLALDCGQDGLFDWDLVANRVWVSPEWFERLGFGGDVSGRGGRYYLGVIHPADRRDMVTHFRDHLQGRVSSMEIEYRRRSADGNYIWVLLRARIVEFDESGRALRLVGSLMDITRRKEAELHVIHMAHHDALTGLPNRILFQNRMSDALARPRPAPVCHAVLVCDLDRFKAVNDTFGHLQGDRLLCTVADRIAATLGPHDTLARLGGDEFGVFLDSVADEAAVHAACQRILSAVSEPLAHQGRTIDIAISIGVVLVNDGTATADELFRQADMAMYQAKASGRNTYQLLEAKVLARDSTRGWLALDMKDAIRRGDFFLVYQPVIDMASGEVSSFEALMRWQHPIRGMISPADFIPVAEETGMIVQLGAWALEEACREAMTWDQRLRVGVNVSPVQFRHGLEQAALSALAKTGLPPGRLKLEVTESVLMQDADGALACLHRLRAIGIRIALDDFGTGYSSLSYLRRFPFDKLKIDRSFIRDIDDPDTAAIIRAVVGIGQRLGMTIVAEGVETVQQLEAVRREGCNEVQGFLFSKPLPAQEARAFIATRPVRAA